MPAPGLPFLHQEQIGRRRIGERGARKPRQHFLEQPTRLLRSILAQGQQRQPVRPRELERGIQLERLAQLTLSRLVLAQLLIGDPEEEADAAVGGLSLARYFEVIASRFPLAQAGTRQAQQQVEIRGRWLELTEILEHLRGLVRSLDQQQGSRVEAERVRVVRDELDRTGQIFDGGFGIPRAQRMGAALVVQVGPVIAPGGHARARGAKKCSQEQHAGGREPTRSAQECQHARILSYTRRTPAPERRWTFPVYALASCWFHVTFLR
ncbi:MAG: hypothetical protein O7B29_09810 [Deltaproteobacteria bacterium]|nr:hypothetical protein [Deltaproteobacteria bacterium]